MVAGVAWDGRCRGDGFTTVPLSLVKPVEPHCVPGGGSLKPSRRGVPWVRFEFWEIPTRDWEEGISLGDLE